MDEQRGGARSRDGERARRLRGRWDRESRRYDREMTVAERRLFPGVRQQVCGLAEGRTLEVAIGTGLNLPHYPAAVVAAGLTGVEWSPGMLGHARRRAAELGLDVDLRLGDAQALDLPDGAFDTVVSTLSMCTIPDHEAALAEMVRVARPGGLVLLADHVASSFLPLRLAQSAVDLVTGPLLGEYFARRPMRWVQAHGLAVERHERTRLGVIERLAARTPARSAP
ncbi:class I SAM-dependent methyltransferase [Cellulosimicrobium cellulans]|uniref:class I SAM-dependent methyltransferase n=1 Tax=Cellulosimicrobium cellulans TaxID=1710 RepID=UPI00084885D6|nr:class I SAM-dependent methyltransferase [Cellulosimicrobium cellulans]